jgi:hypothetical protein
MRWAGHAARVGEKRNAYGAFVENPEGMRQLGRPGCRLEDSIRMDLKGIGYQGPHRIPPFQDRVKLWALVTTVMNLRVP